MASARQDRCQATPMSFPNVSSERCVHALAPFASCRACVDACPHSAWVLDDEGLDLDVGACDGCGLCAPACPQDAVAFDPQVHPVVHAGSDHATAFAACDRVARPDHSGCIPCLHAIGLRELARLYAGGVRRLVVSRGPCATCPRDTSATLEKSLRDLGRLLTDRGISDFEYIEMEPDAWRVARQEAGRMSRRGFFRALAPVQNRAARISEEFPQPVSPFAILPSRETANISPVVPQIDAASCRACGACLELCPHDVIELVGQDGQRPRYETNSGTCTGCRLCIDACGVDAIRLTSWEDPRPRGVALVLGQCEACGNAYYQTIASNSASSRCYVCAASQHQQNLFQVLP